MLVAKVACEIRYNFIFSISVFLYDLVGKYYLGGGVLGEDVGVLLPWGALPQHGCFRFGFVQVLKILF